MSQADPLMRLIPGPAYLGDGVYIKASGWGTCVDLTTSDGLETTNRIVLEPEVMRALYRYMTALEAGVSQLIRAREEQKEEQ